MHWKQWKTGGYLLAATLMVTGLSIGKTRAYDKNLTQEATNLLNSLKTDAQKVQTDTSNFQNLAKNDWQANSSQWNQIKQQVGEMSSKVSRLEAISSSVRPWQRKAIIRTTPMVRLMSMYTDDAISYLNSHRNDFVDHAYRKYEQNVVKESRKIPESVNKLEEHAQSRQRST